MRFLALFLCLGIAGAFGAPPPAAAQDARAVAAMGAAMGLIAQRDWPAARAEAAPAGPVAQAIVAWYRLRAGDGTWDEVRAFLARHPDWPGLALMRRKGEVLIPAGAPAAKVRAYFEGHPPQTGAGVLALARADEAAGDTGEALASVVLAWRSFSLARPERKAFLRRYGKLLAPHHAARLDMLLWRGLITQARAVAPLAGKDWAALAAARIALRQNASGVDALIKAVPAALRDDPGLAYERFRWRLRKGRTAEAATLILTRSASAEALGEPARWASGRRQLARSLMRDGQVKTAYEVARSHHLGSGGDFADLEWLSGYIALRYLDDPAAAIAHFKRFRGAVKSPISLGRAGYWLGRAQAAAGDKDAARAAYQLGARYQTSFYGQLAAEQINAPMDPALMGKEIYPDWRQADFLGSSVLKAALLFKAAGNQRLATRFFLQLGEGLDDTGRGQLADLALSLPDPHSALMIAKQAARRGVVLARAYYPLHPLARVPLPVAPELALSIARRESEFDQNAASGVGARGLMQLMPRTAKVMSKLLKVKYEADKLLGDWHYNARLGTAYLAHLQQELGPSPLLIAAAYNAGPGRVKAWMRKGGDPRAPDVDVVDWIEHIPYRETRNYVMRVAESLLVYRARLEGAPVPLRLLAELKAR